MKSLSIFLMIYALQACVSITKYNSLKNEIIQLNNSKKTLYKEIRIVENKNRKIEDSISEVLIYLELLSTKIEKRLAKFNIYVKLDNKKLSDLALHNQSFSKESLKYMRVNNNFTDTNSAKNTNWLSKDEKELYYWLNYARLNPKEFCMKYIYPEHLQDKNNVYIATLMDYMLHMEPVPALYPDKVLFESARCHAESTGKNGEIGHKRTDGCKSKFSGECCSYGLSKPLDVVIQLLIDKHVSSLGHRYICLGTYQTLGVSAKPHKSYNINYVLDFGYK